MRRVQICHNPTARVTLEEWNDVTREFVPVPLDDATWDVIELASRLNGRKVEYEELQRVIYEVYH